MIKEAIKYNEEELVTQIKLGNPHAIETFFKQFSNKVFRLCMQYLKNEEEAYDMVQDVFATLIAKIHNFKGESKLSTWLYSMTVFSCIGYLRKRNKKNETSIDEVTQNDQSKHELFFSKDVGLDAEQYNPTSDDLINKEDYGVLYREIFNLPADYKAIFILKELERLSIKEIQDIVSISIPAIKTRLHRARLYLRKRLEVHFPEYAQKDNVRTN